MAKTMDRWRLARRGGFDLVLPIERSNRKRTHKEPGGCDAAIRRVLAHFVDQTFGLGRRRAYAAGADEAARALSESANRLVDHA